jgi:uncharacterized protein (UPF0333 family)
MEKRGQSALEYLMTYGWALIVIAIVIGILIYVTSSTTGGVTCQSQSPALILREWAVSAGTNGVGLTLRNATGDTIYPSVATGGGSFLDQNANLVSSVSKNATFTVTELDAPSSPSTFSDGYVYINYTTAGGLDANATIICAGTV